MIPVEDVFSGLAKTKGKCLIAGYLQSTFICLLVQGVLKSEILS